MYPTPDSSNCRTLKSRTGNPPKCHESPFMLQLCDFAWSKIRAGGDGPTTRLEWFVSEYRAGGAQQSVSLLASRPRSWTSRQHDGTRTVSEHFFHICRSRICVVVVLIFVLSISNGLAIGTVRLPRTVFSFSSDLAIYSRPREWSHTAPAEVQGPAGGYVRHAYSPAVSV